MHWEARVRFARSDYMNISLIACVSFAATSLTVLLLQFGFKYSANRRALTLAASLFTSFCLTLMVSQIIEGWKWVGIATLCSGALTVAFATKVDISDDERNSFKIIYGAILIVGSVLLSINSTAVLTDAVSAGLLDLNSTNGMVSGIVTVTLVALVPGVAGLVEIISVLRQEGRG
jgi:hypothetical protein